jgi:O-antigen ligase
MTHSIKIVTAVIVALVVSIVLSVQPLYRIFPALLNESLSIAFWMIFSAWGLLRYRSDFKWLLQTTKSALFFCGVFLVVLVVQYALGHSVPYGGYIALHAGAAVACMVALMGGASFAGHTRNTYSSESRCLALGLFLVALVQSLIGWLQFLELHVQLSWVAKQGVGGRAFGNLRQYNLFALLMLLGLLSLALFLEQQQNTAPNKITQPARSRMKLFAIYLLAAVLMGTLVASASRFGMLMCIFFLMLAYIDFRKHENKRAVFFLSLPLMYASWYIVFVQLDYAEILPYYGTQRAISLEALSVKNNSDRMEIWTVAVELIKAHTWFGVGYGQLPYYSAVEQLGWNFYLLLDYAHNFFLQWALDFGLPIACILFGLLIYTAFQLRTVLKNSDGRILAAFLLFPVIHELIEFPLHYPTFLMPWCVLLGFLLSSCSPRVTTAEVMTNSTTERQFIRTKNVMFSSGALIIAVMAVHSIFDSAKPAKLFQSQSGPVSFQELEHAYTSIAFEHIADFAVIQTVPVTTATAMQIHKLVAKVALLRFDINVATVYLQASALDGSMCVAKSILYRLLNADAKSKARVTEILRARTEPQFRELEKYSEQPYPVEWQPSRAGNC